MEVPHPLARRERPHVTTDEAPNMKWIGKEFASHQTTNHLQSEYARGDVQSNTAESFFAIVKRSVHGVHHHVSVDHLDRYIGERCFVWNHRSSPPKASGCWPLFKERMERG